MTNVQPHEDGRPGDLSARFLTVADAAARLQVSEKTIRRAVEAGRLRAHKIAGRLRIAPSDFTTYVNSCRVEQCGPALDLPRRPSVRSAGRPARNGAASPARLRQIEEARR